MSIKPDPRPLYLLVIEKIKQDIDTGQLQPGQKLPSEFELSKELGVSRSTLREALRMLEDESVIIRKQGIGTFIKSKPLFTSGIEELYSITHMIENHGYKAGTIFINTKVSEASKDEMEKFQLDGTKEDIIRIERIRTADNEPVVFCIDKLPKRVLSDELDVHKYGSIFQALKEEASIEISYAIAEIEPLGYHEKISPLLHISKEIPLIILKQIHYDITDRPILISVNYFRADKFRFQVVRKR